MIYDNSIGHLLWMSPNADMGLKDKLIEVN